MSDVIGRGVIEVEVNDAGVDAGIAKIERTVANLGKTAGAAGKEASSGINQIGDGGDAAARKVDAATKNMIGSIQRTTAALEAGSKSGSKYYEMLAQQRGINVDALRPYLAQLDAASVSQTKAGISAGQMQAALRGLPAQFTDIAVSLASGQQPLTVLLQQGGQLKDMFGGIGPAVQALGGYVLGLINPLTVTAAVFAVVAYEAYQGEENVRRFNDTAKLTGGSLGVTRGEMERFAESIHVAGEASTQGAREMLDALARAGRLGGYALKEVAQAALDYADVSGEKADSVAADFAKMGDGVAKWAAEHNKSLHFISAADYEYIQRMEELGNKQEAIRVVTDRLHKQMGTTDAENLGILVKIWVGWGRAIDAVAESLKHLGAGSTAEEKFMDLDAAVQRTMKSLSSTLLTPAARATLQRELQAQIKERNALAEQIATNARESRIKAEDAQATEDSIAYQNFIKAHEDNAKKRQSALQEINAKYFGKEFAQKYGAGAIADGSLLKAAMVRVHGGDAEATLKEYRAARAATENQYKDPKGPKHSAYGTDADRDVAGLSAKIDAEKLLSKTMDELGPAYEKLTEGEKLALKYRREVGVATTDAAKANLEMRAGLADELGAQQSLSKAIADRIGTGKALDDADRKRSHDLELQQEDMRKQVEFMTMSEQRRTVAQAQWEIEKRTKQQLFDLQKQINEALDDQVAAEKRLADAKTPKVRATAEAALNERKRRVADLTGEQIQIALGADQEKRQAVQYANDRLAASTDWTAGATRALENYADNATRIADEVGGAFDHAFSGMEDALAAFVKTGKLSFSSLANSIIDDMIRISIRQSITGPLASMMSGGFSGMFQREGAAAPIVDGTAGATAVQAKGGAWLDGVQFYANGGVFDRPTAFSHAGGLGVLGEAGPEAVMPLTRDAQGRLGVRSGGGQGEAPAVTVNVINQSSQQVNASASQPKWDGVRWVQDIILSDLRRNGPIRNAIKGL